jgi:KUP system potassium uptake protein
MANGIVAEPTSDLAPPQVSAPPLRTSLLALIIGSIGVVYGDIGTSPLSAFRVPVANETGPTAATVWHPVADPVVADVIVTPQIRRDPLRRK